MIDGVAILGHYGGWNTGDEAILVSITRELRAKSADVAVDAISRRFGPIGVDVCGAIDVRPVSLLSLQCLRSLTRRRLVIGGGQMLAGDGGPLGMAILVAAAAINRLAGQGPIVAFVGVHHLRSTGPKLLARLLCRLATRVSVRDAASRDELVSTGVPESRVVLSADVVLGGAIRTEPTSLPDADGPVVVVGHRSPHRRLISERDFLGIVDACREMPGDREVVVASHDARAAFDNGLEPELVGHLGDAGDWRFEPFDSLDDQFALYETASSVVSVRMHPLIIASVLGVPAVAVRGSRKVASIAAELGLPIVDPDADAETLATAIANHPGAPAIERLRDPIDRDVEAIIRR